MIKVNLISKKKRKYVGRNWTKIVSFSLFGIFTTYFIGVSIYVVISLMVDKNKISQVEEETSNISAEMLNNNEKLSRFVLTKLTLSQIEDINSTKFHYLDYLNQISLLLPQGNTLTGIDFKNKGWIVLAVESNNIYSFESFEKILLNKSTWENNKYFQGAYIENVSKNIDGSFGIHLQFELKKNV